MVFRVSQITDPSPSDLYRLPMLMRHLTGEIPFMSIDMLQRKCVAHPILVVRECNDVCLPDHGYIVGTLTIILEDIITGLHGHFRNIVVDPEFENMGIFKYLWIDAITYMASIGAESISIPTNALNPNRKKAIGVYTGALGFTVTGEWTVFSMGEPQPEALTPPSEDTLQLVRSA